MTAHHLALITESVLIFFLGVYVTLLGHRKIGKKPGQDLKYDATLEKTGGTLRTLGPLIILGAVLMYFIRYYSSEH
jgi:hypothetical protein